MHTLTSLAFIGGLGPLELSIILVVALLLFGKRLPDVMRSMGRGVVEFKKGIRGIEDDVNVSSDKAIDVTPKEPQAPSESK